MSITADECIKAAFDALLRGDTAERDRLCKMAEQLMRAGDRVRSGDKIIEGEFIEVGPPIALTDRSKEALQ